MIDPTLYPLIIFVLGALIATVYVSYFRKDK